MSDDKYKSLDFWYDEQIMRYFQQFLRIFSGFQYTTGRNENGLRTTRRVPCRYADLSRMVAHILRNNSENTLLSVPMITAHITDIAPAPDLRQGLGYVRKSNVVERAYDPIEEQYTSNIGIKSTIESYMPTPMMMTCQVDIWVSNIVQKLQLFEQIIVLFNPSLEIQSSVNALDWAALTRVELQDVVWSSRSVPVGTDDSLDIMTLRFRIPIYINPPSKVKNQRIIEQIITNIHDGNNINIEDLQYATSYSEDDLLTRIIITPNDAKIVVDGSYIYLYSGADDPLSWEEYLQQYGVEFRENISKIKINTSGTDIENDTDFITGYLQYDTENSNALIWTADADTLPVNTIDSIDAIIDPHKSSPTSGLPMAITGQRYLILDELGESSNWQMNNKTASKNDIIQYNGSYWEVVFTAKYTTTIEYVKNTLSGKQLRWNGTSWQIVPDATYGPGYWRLDL